MKNSATPFLDIRFPDDLVVRVVGLGGIGQIVATFLVRFLRGSVKHAARVVLYDGDDFESGNDRRMSVPGLYENKATALQARLAAECSVSPVTVLAVPEFVTPDNIEQLVPGGPGESVLLCVDNHATRNLVGEYVRGLDNICLISGGNDGVGPDSGGTMRHGTAGNVQVHLRTGGKDLTPPITEHHPEIANPRDRRPDEQSCTELMVSVPQILFTNLSAASWMLDTWFLHAAGELHYSELVFDTHKARAAPLMPLPGKSIR